MMRVAAILLAVLALGSCSRDPQVVKKRYLENGNKYFAKGKFREASIMYRNALQKDMRYGEAHYRYGLAELRLGHMPQAVASLRRAVELVPASQNEHWDAAIKLAEIYLAVTRDRQYLSEVETITKELLQRDPNSYDGHRLTGDMTFVLAQDSFRGGQRDKGKEQITQAIAEYRKADAAKPGQTPLRMALARTLAADRQFAEAEQLYKQLLAGDPKLALAYTELYQLFLYQNKAKDAETVIKTAIANNPKHYSFMTLLAAHYYGQGRRQEMAGVLNQMKSHAKELPQAYLMAGDFYLRVGDGDAAIREYREGIEGDKQRKLDYQKRIIEVFMRQGKKVEAAEMNAAILKERPKDADARGLEASFLLDKGDVSRAIAELQAVVAAAPDNFVARYHLGRAHMARSEWEQARQQFAKAIELRPDYMLARLSLAQLLVSRGEFEGALKSVAAILQADPNNGSARLIESAALLGMKKYQDSRQLLHDMLAKNANSPDVYFQLGVVNLAENKYKEAEDAFRKAYQLNPANPRGLMGVVETYMVQNKADQALEMLQNETRRFPARTDFRVALGNTAVRAGRYDVAIGEFQQALRSIDPKSRMAGDVYLRLGETFRRKGDLNSSIGYLQKAHEIMPENSTVVSTLALTLDGAGRKSEARHAYEQTLNLEPGNGLALNNLAFIIAESGGDLDQALTFAQRAKQVLPDLLEVSDTLGWIYLKKNLSDNAVQIFSDLVKKEPNHSTYRYHLGMALSQKGDKVRARTELEQALKSNPTKDEAAKIRALMTKIG